MKRINISDNEFILSSILGGSGSVDDIGLNDAEHMLPLYCKKGGNRKRDAYLEGSRFFQVSFPRGRHHR
ncbi:MAG: hypothetical protein ACI4T3_05405 [Lactobacillus sp.]